MAFKSYLFEVKALFIYRNKLINNMDTPLLFKLKSGINHGLAQ